MNKGKSIGNLKYFFLSLFLFFVVFLCVFPKTTFAADRKISDCYVGSTKIGTLEIQGNGGQPWMVVGKTAGMVFSLVTDDISIPDEVFFRLGGLSWVAPSHSSQNYVFEAWFTADSQACGNTWANVTWRSVRDGQMHYCSVLVKKYTAGEAVSNFLNSGCLSTDQGCVKSGLNPKVVKQALLFGPAVSWEEKTRPACSQHLFSFMESRNSSYFMDYSNECYPIISRFSDIELSESQIVGKLSPSIAGHSIIDQGPGTLQLYNFISNTTCGTCYGCGPQPTVAPTATPTPVSCSLAVQSMSFSGSGTPLINDYNTTQYKGSPQYVVFTSNKTGKITKTEIYGTLDRNVARGNKTLQCKITDNTGTTNLGESNPNNGPFSKGVFWFPVTFPTPVNVVNGTSYRLYCKVNNLAGGGTLYWLDNCWKRTDKAYKLYMCE